MASSDFPSTLPAATPERQEPKSPGASYKQEILAAGLLLAITLAALGGVCSNGFINYDDPYFITDNPHVHAGLTLPSFCWAWTTIHAANWHPLTWLSLQLDWQMYRGAAWGFHLTNLLLHLASTLVLFGLLHRATGAVWQSACVAALFAVHPLHVESVAWATERKDVLSTLFWMLTMAAYVLYAERPRWWRYLPVALLFALGLTAKSMLVTLPGVLCLLDFWPLRRFPGFAPAPGSRTPTVSWRRLVAEKVPLLALSVASAAVTMYAQQQAGEANPPGEMPLRRLQRPDRLRLLHRQDAMAGQPRPLLSISGYNRSGVSGRTGSGPAAGGRHGPGGRAGPTSAVPARRLVMVSGNSGSSARRGPGARRTRHGGSVHLRAADRAVPALGVGRLRPSGPLAWGGLLATVLAGSLVAACVAFTRMQTSYWTDSVTLWSHAVQVTAPNPLTYASLGEAFTAEDDDEKALSWLARAVSLKTDNPTSQYELGAILVKMNRPQEAEEHLLLALRLKPDRAATHLELGGAFMREGRIPEAASQFREAVRLRPGYLLAHLDLGMALAMLGKEDEALGHLDESLRLDPRIRSSPRTTAASCWPTAATGRKPSPPLRRRPVGAGQRRLPPPSRPEPCASRRNGGRPG